MTSRERVTMAVNFEEPDRVPIDLNGMRCTAIMAAAYDKLKKYLGINGKPPRVYDLYQMLAEVEEPIRKRFQIDVIGLQRLEVAFGIRNERWKPWRLFDGTEVEVPGDFNPIPDGKGGWQLIREGELLAEMPKDGYYFDPCDSQPGGARVNVDEYQPPIISNEELDFLHEQARSLYENTDYAILGGFYAEELFFGMGRGDYTGWWTAMLTEQEWVRALYEKSVQAWIENARRYLDAVGEYILAIVFADDFGMQKGEFISPALFRDLVAPYYKKIFDWIHQNSEVKIFFHSCGSIYRIIPDLIDSGVDILNPVQCSAANMEPERLKRGFGDRLVFWGGGVDTQQTLPFGNPEQVREEVAERIRIFGEDAGYVFAAVHNIQQHTPPENIVAAFDTAIAEGRYPLTPRS